MSGLKIGFGICGSFCTFHHIFPILERLKEQNNDIFPIMSRAAYTTDTRFGQSDLINKKIEDICERSIISTLSAAEPIGPKKMLDIMAVVPCTGNTLGKLACGITDTPVTLAVKAHLRNQRPVVIAVSTNDALAASAQNIGRLLNNKNIFFVPMREDDPKGKPTSLVADFSRVAESIDEAVKGRQIHPIFG